MSEYIMMALVYGSKVVGQAIGVLLGSSPIAGILKWRARKLKGWVIRYKDAYVVSIKAGLIALVAAHAVVLTFVATFGLPGAMMNDGTLLRGIASLSVLGAWWMSHNRALVNLAGTATPCTIQDARKLSANVFAFSFVVFGIPLLVIQLITGTVTTAPQGEAKTASDRTSKFNAFQMKTRQSEAKTSLRGIYVAEMAYYKEHKRFGSFEEIGMTMTFDHYYTYRIDASGKPGTVIPSNKSQVTPDNSVVPAGYTATGFTATATANIDEDATIDQWHLNESNCCLDHADVDDVTK